MAILNQIMSPLLPVALEVGQLHAVERLKVFVFWQLHGRNGIHVRELLGVVCLIGFY